MSKPSRGVAALIALVAAAATVPALGQTDGRAGSYDNLAWTEAVAPFRIIDRIYYVGTRDLTAFLIDSGDGLILIDTGVPETAQQLIANIRTLGFDPADVRILLNSQAHIDHAGGLAEVKAATGAKMLASRADAELLERGGRGDFFHGDKLAFPPVEVDGFVGDGQRVTLGRVTLTAHLTPGHTKGCTTWTMPVEDKRRRLVAQFNCSVTVPGYRLLGNARYPEMADDYRRTFDKLRSLPCDVFLAAHGSFFDFDDKRARLAAGAAVNPFIDPEGCRSVIALFEKRFRDQLARERSEQAGAGQ